MRIRLLLLARLAVALILPIAVPAIDTAFTYQGFLEESTAPAEGTYDLRFILMDDDIGGAQVGAIKEVPGVVVTRGVFTTELDFGANAFTGPDRWLETAVRKAGQQSYQVLSPRQPIRATPYSLTSSRALVADSATTAQSASTAIAAPNHVAKAGDTMTGLLQLPDNGLKVGGNQLAFDAGKVGIGTTAPQSLLHLHSTVAANPPALRFTIADGIDADRYLFHMDSTGRLFLQATTFTAAFPSGIVMRAEGTNVTFQGKVNVGALNDNNISTLNIQGSTSLRVRPITGGNANSLFDTDLVLLVNVTNGTVIIPPDAATCKGRV